MGVSDIMATLALGARIDVDHAWVVIDDRTQLGRSIRSGELGSMFVGETWATLTVPALERLQGEFSHVVYVPMGDAGDDILNTIMFRRTALLDNMVVVEHRGKVELWFRGHEDHVLWVLKYL